MDRQCNSIDQLIALFTNMDINRSPPKEDRPETWFLYKGQLIKSKEDFKQMVIREMRLPY